MKNIPRALLRNGISSEASSGSKSIEIKIPVPWGHVSGKWWGSRNSVPLLGLHGWQDNAGTFDGIAALLSDRVSFLAVDLPGHGFSSWYPSSTWYNSSQGLLLVRRIVKHFKWEKISIVGHSMGSAYGFLYAAVFPDEVEKFIGLDLARPMAAFPNKLVFDAASVIDNCLRSNHIKMDSVPKYSFEELVERMLKGYQGSLNKQSCEVLLKRGAIRFPCGKFSFARDPRLNSSTNDLSAFSLPLLNKLATCIKCEVLNIRGTSGLQYINDKDYYKALDMVRKNASKLEFHEIEGTHHFHMDDPSRTASLITKFLN